MLEDGARRIDVLSDGHLVLPRSFVFEPIPDEVTAEMSAAFDLGETIEPPCNLTLLRDGEAAVLFDAGSGAEFMPTAGRLWEAIGAIGVAPDEITHLVLTHAHPDHLWGLLDDFGDPAFPEAEVLIGAAERAYWTDPATVESIGAARQAFAVGAARRLGEVATTAFEDGDEVAPGVVARLTPGHTPGHMSFEVAMDGAPLTVIGDAIGNHHVAMRHPALPSGADQDAGLAAQTRLALLSALTGAPAVGFHLPGGLGSVRADGGAYAWEPSS